MSLFGSATQRDNRRLLLTIRSGRMFRKTEDNLIHPDPRSGVLTLTMESSGVIDMKWEAMQGTGESNKQDGASEGPASESTILMPGGAKFIKVDKCTTGRVFCVDFGTRQVFYWLQEQPDAERDASYFRALKNAIEGGGAGRGDGQSNRGGGRGTAAAGSRGAGSGGRAGASAVGDDSAGVTMAALQNIMQSLGGPNAAAATSATSGPKPPDVRLNDVLRASSTRDAIKADKTHYTNRLKEHLPEGQAEADIVNAIMNPQASSCAHVLDAALSDPAGYREVLHAFNVTPPEGVPPSTFGLLQAILNEPKKEKSSEATTKKESEAGEKKNEDAAEKKEEGEEKK